MRNKIALIFACLSLSSPAHSQFETGSPTATSGELMRILSNYCIKHDARPEDVIATATEDGWVRLPRDALDSSETLAKEISGLRYVIVVSADENRVLPQFYDLSCAVTGPAPFDATVADLENWVGLPPTQRVPRDIWFTFFQGTDGKHSAASPQTLIDANGSTPTEIGNFRTAGAKDEGDVVSLIFGATSPEWPPLLKRLGPGSAAECKPSGKGLLVRASFTIGTNGQVIGPVDTGEAERSADATLRSGAQMVIRRVKAREPYQNLPPELYDRPLKVVFRVWPCA